MKNWTIEELAELWIYRGYSKKAARATAEKEYKEMHRPKSPEEIYQTTQEMQYT